MVRTSPRLIARHTAFPSPRRRVSRRGGGRPQLRISLRNCHIIHRRALVLFLMGKLDHAAPLGGAVVSVGVLFELP